jgi:hypothetical protein
VAWRLLLLEDAAHGAVIVFLETNAVVVLQLAEFVLGVAEALAG